MLSTMNIPNVMAEIWIGLEMEGLSLFGTGIRQWSFRWVVLRANAEVFHGRKQRKIFRAKGVLL